ncbi:MAG: 50S ribosomal protein L10 [Deltaproteobacteria bacterium]|nr:50S ribosomal protein L10 [Deltaproteobacteria bacterium]
MAKDKAAKTALRDELAGLFNKAQAAIVAEYSGISANELANLRVELRKIDTEFKVVKNRIAKKAIEDSAHSAEELKDRLTGPVGVAYLNGDVAAGAKAMLAFAKGNEKFKVTGGVFEGKALSVKDIQALSELPSREELLAKIIGSLVSPHRGLLHCINGVGSNLVRVINAIKDKKA